MEQSKATGKVKDYPLNESTIQHQLDRLAKTHPNNREELLDTLTAHDMLKRFHHQLRAEYYWSTLINVNNRDLLGSHHKFLEFDFKLNLTSGTIDKIIASSIINLNANLESRDKLIAQLIRQAKLRSPEYLLAKRQEIQLAMRYHTIKKESPKPDHDLNKLYANLVKNRRQQAKLCGLSSYRRLCEQIDGRDTITDLLSVIPNDIETQLKAFSSIPTIKAPVVSMNALEQVRNVFIHIPFISEIFDAMIAKGAFDIENRAEKANIRGLMLFHHYTKEASIFANNISGIELYDVLAHEVAHACHWTLSTQQTYFEFCEPHPDFAEIVAIFFEFVAAEIIDDDQTTLKWKIYSRLASIFWSFRLFEFEAAIYAEQESSLDHAWNLCSQKYLLNSSWPISKLENNWMLYSQPFYYSRYALATLVAWILYGRYKEDKGSLNILTKLMTNGSFNPLSSIFDELKIEIHSLDATQTIEQMLRALKS